MSLHWPPSGNVFLSSQTGPPPLMSSSSSGTALSLAVPHPPEKHCPPSGSVFLFSGLTEVARVLATVGPEKQQRLQGSTSPPPAERATAIAEAVMRIRPWRCMLGGAKEPIPACGPM